MGQWGVLGMVTESGDRVVLTSHFLRKSQGLVKRHGYFMQAVCTLL